MDGCVVPRVVSVHAPVFSGDIHEKVDAAIRSRLRVLFAAPLHSTAIVSVVALRLERALAIGALVFRTRDQSAFVGRAAAFAAWSTFGC